MESISTVFVYGLMNDTIFASARSRAPDLDLGEALRMAFDPIGSAGGHADMAGAQIPLGVIGHRDDEEELDVERVVWDLVTDRFLDALGYRQSEVDEFVSGRSDLLVREKRPEDDL
jgi:nanoRNase/pAp phosphatase (c-di-AMP/oligoRNAs hydrolase)